jgi:geranylgeranyl reductase family protein
LTDYDVIVVGAGPGGAESARTAARAGLRTLLLEEHATVGVPSHCTGKLSFHAFDELEIPRSLANTAVSAAVLYSPGGVAVRVRRRTVDSFAVDRIAFDRWVAERAARAGAELVTGVKATEAARQNGSVVVRGTRGTRTFQARARMLIDAEGSAPRLLERLGAPIPRRHALGLQYEMRGIGGIEPDTPEMFFGEDVAPGFFAWLMPIGGGLAKVGLAVDPRRTSRAPVWYLRRLLEAHPALRGRAAGATVERKVAGRIPLVARDAPTSADRVLVVGDAAGMVKATSGGGIYYAMTAGRVAGEAAARYLGGDPAALGFYERGWRRRIGREVRFTAFSRRAINRLSDAELDTVMRAIAESPQLLASIGEAGDTQFQSKLFAPLLRGLAQVTLRRPVVAPLVAKALVMGMFSQI